VGVVRARAKGELEDLHPRKAELFAQGFYFRRDEAKVFGNDWDLAQGRFEGIEELSPRPFNPPPFDSRFFPGRHFPIGFKTTEVVNPDYVYVFQDALKPLYPPIVAPFGQDFPAVDWVPPELPCRAKVIGRDAGHYGRQAFFVQLEEFGVSPHVSRIVGYVDWDIADDAYAFFGSVPSQGLPLPVKDELGELVEEGFFGQFSANGFQSFRVPQGQLWLPFVPGCTSVGFFDGHEEGIIIKPVSLPATENFKLGLEAPGSLEFFKSFAQEKPLEGPNRGVIYPVLGEGGKVLPILWGRVALLRPTFLGL